jgi:uncharacterized protein (TIGR02001 family)
MTRRREVGIIKSCVLGAAFALALATAAQADDKKLTLSGTATITTDYIFRGISFSGNEPAVQPSFTATYGMFYAGVWGSNIELDGTSVELDYYAGIAPTWKGFTFDIAGLYYTYPGAHDPVAGELDYFELKTAVKYTFAEKLTIGISNYWSPQFGGGGDNADALELGAAYAFSGKLFNFFSPTISGLIGWEWVENNFNYVGWDPYTYWNAGLTLGFMERWSADVRYWDTDLDGTDTSAGSISDARVVGTVTATF